MKVPGIKRALTGAFACAVVAFSTGCTSMAPQVHRSADDYSEVMEAFTDQVLFTNVLRARDQAPLNFSDLPIIHGSIAATGSLGLTLPFGANNASTTRNTAAGALQFSSSPTFDTSSLNTEAFTLNMLQPVSPVFIESLWRAGLPRELLLHLFAESIQLPEGSGSSTTYFNRPESPDDGKFLELVDTMVAHDAQLHSFTVLDPIGVPLALGKTADGQVDATDASALKVYTEVMGLDPARFKVEYVSGKTTAGFQIYRRFGSQIALCIARSSRSDADADVIDRALDALSRILGKGSPATLLLGNGAGPRSPAGPGSSDSTGAGNSGATKASSAHSGTNTAMTQAVQAYRISGILNSAQCSDEEYVADRVGEAAYVRSTREFGNVRWRSTIDLYYYLGALARDPQRSPTWVDAAGRHVLFQVVPGGHGEMSGITVTYHGDKYSVLGDYPAKPGQPVSHGLQVISLISQLVNIAKISNDIPVTRSFEILP